MERVPVVLGYSSSTGTYSLPLDDKFRNIKIREFNEVNDELAFDSLNNIDVVQPNFYTYYLENYINEYFDNLHPNGIGYRSMADLWRNALIE